MSWNMFSRFGAGSDPDIVSFGDLEEAIGTNAWTVVDVREPHEFATGHIPNALNMPMSSFDPKDLPEGKPVVLICQAGGRSRNALNKARAIGPRGCEALCRGHERLALAQRTGDALKRARLRPVIVARAVSGLAISERRFLLRLARDIGLAHRPIVAERERAKSSTSRSPPGRLHPVRERRRRARIERDKVGLLAGFDRADTVV